MTVPLRLLMPVESLSSAEGSFELLGRYWVLSERSLSGTEYVCVSYSWGPGRVRHPLHPPASHVEISDRALPALEAALRDGVVRAVWIDALCVPSDGLARTACLHNLGAIYAGAAQVIVVLSPASAGFLGQIARERRVDEARLLEFEADPWITRAWTYQEVVNSKRLSFVVEDGSNVIVDAQDLLSPTGKAIDDYKKAKGLGAFAFRSRHPRLDALEDVIADWLTAGYQERSAYQVLSTMHSRSSERPDDFVYAMLGAISAEPFTPGASPAVPPVEHFLRMCEAKGDFSFIFTDAPRSSEQGRCWRPLADELRPVFPWHSFGAGQQGFLEPTQLQLHQLQRLSPGPLAPEALQSLATFLGEARNTPRTRDAVRERLREAGFAGRGEPIEFAEGYFFPLSECRWSPHLTALASTGIRWAFGAPGLVVYRDTGGPYAYRDVGVFIGHELRGDVSIVLG